MPIRPGLGLKSMKGEKLNMKNLLKALRENFVLVCEAYYNTYVRL